MAEQIQQKKQGGLLGSFIRGVEFVGNKLPQPFWLFVMLCAIILGLSYWLANEGVSVTYMAAKAGEAPAETKVAVENLFTFKQMRALFSDFVKIYINFAPLGLILVMTLGIALIEQTGLISAFMRKTILGAPSWLVSTTLAIVGINANLASDAGIIFTPAIGAAIYKALGRNPWVGIITGYAAASGGFTANFFVAGTDALLAGITKSAADAMNIAGPTHPLINWYFMIASTLIITLATTFITETFTSKMLGDEHKDLDDTERAKYAVTADEVRGLRWAGIMFAACIALLLYLTIPDGSFLRADNGTVIPGGTLITGVVAIIFFMFFFIGISYGYGAGTIKCKNDIQKLMQKGLAGATSFMVVVLPAALFIHMFNASKLTTVLAVKGAEYLQHMNLGGIPLLVGFILLCGFVNLFMISGSAKWLILAPIFVPMFGFIGFSPALTQVAYRIGESCTNIISPLSYYLPVILGLMEQYKPDDNREVGVGTVIALELPYCVAYMIGLTVMLILWYYLAIPLGPGAGVSI